MPRKIRLQSGAYEWVDTKEEAESKKKFKAKKKGSDLTSAEIKDLVYKLAKGARLI